MKKTICVDLDGVLADYSKGWQGFEHIGDPFLGAVEFVKKLNELGRVVVYTSRLNNDNPQEPLPGLTATYDFIVDWLDKHGFEYTDIYCGRGKPIAAAYIDDRAVYCNPASHSAENEDIVNCWWRTTLHKVKDLVERSDGFVSDSGTTA